MFSLPNKLSNTYIMKQPDRIKKFLDELSYDAKLENVEATFLSKEEDLQGAISENGQDCSNGSCDGSVNHGSCRNSQSCNDSSNGGTCVNPVVKPVVNQFLGCGGQV